MALADTIFCLVILIGNTSIGLRRVLPLDDFLFITSSQTEILNDTQLTALLISPWTNWAAKFKAPCGHFCRWSWLGPFVVSPLTGKENFK